MLRKFLFLSLFCINFSFAENSIIDFDYISRNSDSEVINKSCNPHAISDDGNFVLFSSQANNIVPGFPSLANASVLYVFDKSNTSFQVIYEAPVGQYFSDAVMASDSKKIFFGLRGIFFSRTVYMYDRDSKALSEYAFGRDLALSGDGNFLVFAEYQSETSFTADYVVHDLESSSSIFNSETGINFGSRFYSSRDFSLHYFTIPTRASKKVSRSIYNLDSKMMEKFNSRKYKNFKRTSLTSDIVWGKSSYRVVRYTRNKRIKMLRERGIKVTKKMKERMERSNFYRLTAPGSRSKFYISSRIKSNRNLVSNDGSKMFFSTKARYIKRKKLDINLPLPKLANSFVYYDLSNNVYQVLQTSYSNNSLLSQSYMSNNGEYSVHPSGLNSDEYMCFAIAKH